MSYTSLFNMLLYDKWEDRLTELLRWLVARSPALAPEMVHRAAVKGDVARVEVRARSRLAGAGAPDAVLDVTMKGGSTGLVAVEVKLGAPTTHYQQNQYAGWLEAQAADQRGFLLMGPIHRTDLAGHPRFLSLDDAFELASRGDGHLTMKELVDDARSWFVDPTIDAKGVNGALTADTIPYWPIKEILRSVRARIMAEAGGALSCRNIAANRTQTYYGFAIVRAGSTIAWCGFYIDEGTGGFYVNLDRGAVRATEDERLGVLPDGRFQLRPWYWQPAEWQGPWSASGIWRAGLAELVREMVAHGQSSG